MALCLGPAPVVPMVLAMAAGVEGAHAVLIGNGAEGGITIKLRHGRETVCGERVFPAVHHHGIASRVICLLAGASSSQADHVMTMAPGSAAEEASEASRVQSQVQTVAPESLIPALALRQQGMECDWIVIPEDSTRDLGLRAGDLQRRCLRSVRLQI